MHHKKKIYLTLYVNNIKLIESDEYALDKISCQIAEHFKIMNKDQIYYYQWEEERWNQNQSFSVLARFHIHW